MPSTRMVQVDVDPRTFYAQPPLFEPLESRLFCSATAAPAVFARAARAASRPSIRIAPRPDPDNLVTTGSNTYFNLTPGNRIVLKGVEDGERISVVIYVTRRTKVVDGVETRVVKEVERADGELTEISSNFFAFDKTTHNMFYFGEHVTTFEDGQIGHPGQWQSGKNGATFGLIMPGDAKPALTYLQENAPGVALDKAHHVSRRATVTTPAGTFTRCLFVRETSALEPGDVSLKNYAPGIGLIQDGTVKLTSVTVNRRR